MQNPQDVILEKDKALTLVGGKYEIDIINSVTKQKEKVIVKVIDVSIFGKDDSRELTVYVLSEILSGSREMIYNRCELGEFRKSAIASK